MGRSQKSSLLSLPPHERARLAPQPVRDRFWSKVNKTSRCWLWTGYRNSKGYGQFTWRTMGRQHLAHRFVLMMDGIAIPDGMLVLHKCDNPGCVNPDHLFVGTAADNSSDMVFKLRSSRGEVHCHAKLRAEQVIDIRRTYEGGGHSQQSLADIYGVKRTTIQSIVNGRTWKWIEQEGEVYHGI